MRVFDSSSLANHTPTLISSNGCWLTSIIMRKPATDGNAPPSYSNSMAPYLIGALVAFEVQQFDMGSQVLIVSFKIRLS